MSRSVPLLMVLYNNDAVEIRYSDGSTLQLSSCGSTMIHHDAASPRKRGSTGTIHKRSRYVTSEHRSKVWQAMDFRNRFAERPYLCKELLDKDQIVALYAHVDSASWCNTPSDNSVELLEDGSRKINSLDGYASLVISPHGHDFTVCYLSKISSENPKPKSVVQKAPKSEMDQPLGNNSRSQTNTSRIQTTNGPQKITPLNPASKSNEAVVHPFQSQGNSEAQLTHRDNVVLQSNQKYEMQNKIAQDYFVPQPKSENYQSPNLMEDFHLSNRISNSQPSADAWVAIQQEDIHKDDASANAQSRGCQMNKQAEPFSNSSINSHDISSISRSSTPDGLRMTIDSDASLGIQDYSGLGHEQACPREAYRLRHSSPTQFTSSPYGEANKPTAHRIKGSCFQVDGGQEGLYLADNCVDEAGGHRGGSLDATLCEENDPLEELSRTVVGEEGNQAESMPLQQKPEAADVRVPALGREESPVVTTGAMNINSADLLSRDHKVNYNTNSTSLQPSYPSYDATRERQHPESSADSEQLSDKSDKKFQSLYVWTTTHVSRNACPPAWTHPLKLVQAAQGQQGHLQQDSIGEKSKTESKGKQCSSLPIPLPVTCPFQHLHKWDAEKTLDVSDVTGSLEFQHGMLKVVISEGIVYRFVTVARIHIVEIHPGDGSVIVSQGVKGHFYTHYITAGDRLEERTYSLKSLPTAQRKGGYSISKLIQTGNRYLMMNQQWERRGLKQEQPCWKREMVAVVEPLSSSLLEECVVDGLGKFSAFTNGRVRAVFEDRTALDMVCNFSKRVGGSLHRGQETKTSLPAASRVTSPVSSYEAIFGASSARLLLPSGQYVTVDIHNPGQYTSYIQAGSEWASWVNSIPMERHQFYTQKHEPTVMLRAAEHELKKIFCFNYILEQTLRMQQDSTGSSFNKGSSLSPPRHSLPSSTAVHSPAVPSLPLAFATLSTNSELSCESQPKTKNWSLNSNTNPSTHLTRGISSDQSELGMLRMTDRRSSINRNQNNLQHFSRVPQSPAVGIHKQTLPRPATSVNYLGSNANPPSGKNFSLPNVHPDSLRARGYCNNPMVNPGLPLDMQSVANRMAQSEERVQSITDGIQAVRQVLLRNSNLINDIDEFLDNSRKQDLLDSSQEK